MLLRATLVALAPSLVAAGERKKKAEAERKDASPRTPEAPEATRDLPARRASAEPTKAATVEPLTLALLAFEAHISWGSVSRTWATRRIRWVRRAKGATSLEDVLELLLTLESAMGWTGMDPRWSRRRDRWLAEVEDTQTGPALASRLLELEAATKWQAVTLAWKAERATWLKALAAIR